MWISADPALGEYLPVAPLDDDAKKHNQQLPGQGGVFNLVNLNLYHYAANNPVRYVDPDGNAPIQGAYNQNSQLDKTNAISVAISFSKTINYSKAIDAMTQNLKLPYESGFYCDDFIIKSLKSSSGDIELLIGDADSLNANDHYLRVKAFGKASDKPQKGLNVVFVNFNDDDKFDHIEIIDLKDDGKVVLYSHGGGKTDSEPHTYDSIALFEASAFGGTNRAYAALEVSE